MFLVNSKTISLLVACLTPLVGNAHHSRTEYSGQPMQEVEGEILTVTWSNPHPSFTLTVSNETEEPQIWDIDGWGSLYTMERAGLTAETVTVNDRVIVYGQLSTRRDNVFLLANMLLSNGTEVIFTTRGEPHWTGSHLGGRDQYVADAGNIVDALLEDKGIFRIWSAFGAEGLGGSTAGLPFTENALRARETFDYLDAPPVRCVPHGMPKMMMTPHPYEFRDHGATIALRGGDFGSTRIIYIDDAKDPETQPPSPLGYSVGHWEGGTLVVNTSRINYPYFDFNGTPQSEDVKILERFTLSEDQTRLDHEITITDPLAFTVPITREQYWLALGESLPRYECAIQ